MLGVLNGPENYNPTPVLKPEPDAARHTSMNCLPKPDPPRVCNVSLCTCYHDPTDSRRKLNRHEYVTQQCQVCVCPSP